MDHKLDDELERCIGVGAGAALDLLGAEPIEVPDPRAGEWLFKLNGRSYELKLRELQT